MAKRGGNAKAFKGEMDRAYEEAVTNDFLFFQRAVAEMGYRELVRHSPVWSGRYRGSHRIAINGVDETILPEYDGPESWPEPIPDARKFRAVGASDIQSRLLSLRPFQKVTLSNSVPYAGRIEDGHSNQAPSGVFGIVAALLNSRFARYRSKRKRKG